MRNSDNGNKYYTKPYFGCSLIFTTQCTRGNFAPFLISSPSFNFIIENILCDFVSSEPNAEMMICWEWYFWYTCSELHDPFLPIKQITQRCIYYFWENVDLFFYLKNSVFILSSNLRIDIFLVEAICFISVHLTMRNHQITPPPPLRWRLHNNSACSLLKTKIVESACNCHLLIPLIFVLCMSLLCIIYSRFECWYLKFCGFRILFK